MVTVRAVEASAMKTSSPSAGTDAPEVPPEVAAQVVATSQAALEALTAYLASPILNGTLFVPVITPPVVVNLTTLPLPRMPMLRLETVVE